MKPTVILVHGAYAESSSWDGVLRPLLADGHRVIAFANPLRGVAGDAALLSDLVMSVDGPVVLAGHSYGGAVITNVDALAGDVVALVYIAGFALELAEPSGERPLWRTVPSWFLFGELDRNIPAAAHHVMAARAGARSTIEIPGASHVVGISHPQETARIILEAAGSRQSAHA